MSLQALSGSFAGESDLWQQPQRFTLELTVVRGGRIVGVAEQSQPQRHLRKLFGYREGHFAPSGGWPRLYSSARGISRCLARRISLGHAVFERPATVESRGQSRLTTPRPCTLLGKQVPATGSSEGLIKRPHLLCAAAAAMLSESRPIFTTYRRFKLNW